MVAEKLSVEFDTGSIDSLVDESEPDEHKNREL